MVLFGEMFLRVLAVLGLDLMLSCDWLSLIVLKLLLLVLRRLGDLLRAVLFPSSFYCIKSTTLTEDFY